MPLPTESKRVSVELLPICHPFGVLVLLVTSPRLQRDGLASAVDYRYQGSARAQCTMFRTDPFPKLTLGVITDIRLIMLLKPRWYFDFLAPSDDPTEMVRIGNIPFIDENEQWPPNRFEPPWMPINYVLQNRLEGRTPTSRTARDPGITRGKNQDSRPASGIHSDSRKGR